MQWSKQNSPAQLIANNATHTHRRNLVMQKKQPRVDFTYNNLSKALNMRNPLLNFLFNKSNTIYRFTEETTQVSLTTCNPNARPLKQLWASVREDPSTMRQHLARFKNQDPTDKPTVNITATRSIFSISHLSYIKVF